MDDFVWTVEAINLAHCFVSQESETQKQPPAGAAVLFCEKNTFGGFSCPINKTAKMFEAPLHASAAIPVYQHMRKFSVCRYDLSNQEQSTFFSSRTILRNLQV